MIRSSKFPHYQVSTLSPQEGHEYSAQITEASGQVYIAPMLYVIIDAANFHVNRSTDRCPSRFHKAPPLGAIHKSLGSINGRPC